MPSKIKAYRCSVCHTLFAKEENAVKCEKGCKAAIARQKKCEQQQKERDEFWYATLKAASLDELHDMIVKNLARVGVKVKFNAFNFRFSPSVSNSHHCPLKGVTNWSGEDENAPTSYPGWVGEISGTLKTTEKALQALEPVLMGFSAGIDNLMEFLAYGIHCGCGCPGGLELGRYRKLEDTFSISARIFLDDFPVMKKMYSEYSKLQDREAQHKLEFGKRLDKYRTSFAEMLEKDDRCRKARDRKAAAEKEVRKASEALAAYQGALHKADEKRRERMLAVPAKFRYDEYRLEELRSLFSDEC